MSQAHQIPPASAGPLAPPGTTAERADAIAAAVPGVTLGRRLTSFRRVLATNDRGGVDAPARDDLAVRLAAAVGGVVLDGPAGCVVRLDAGMTRMPVDRARLQGLPGQPPADRRLVCLDTETTGLGTGAGTVAWIVGVGSWDGDALRVVQFLLPDHPDEPALLDAVAAEIGDAPVLVTYNGRSFDWPLLVARYRLHGRAAPSLGGHLDLLPIVRRLFRHRLGAARLRTVEEGVLGVARHDDVEGWEIPALYLDFLRGGAASPLSRVARHNAEDIRSLGRLLAHLDASLADPSARPAAHPGDLASLAEMLRIHGRHHESLACLEQALSTLRDPALRDPAPAQAPEGDGRRERLTALLGLPVGGAGGTTEGAGEPPWWSPRTHPHVGGSPTGRASERMAGRIGRDGPVNLATVLAARARALRRLGRDGEAAAAWEELASVAGAAAATAWIEVAKIREHAQRDPAGALEATDRALALLARRRAAGRPDHAAEAAAARRHVRLARRIARGRGTVRTAGA